MRVSENVTKTPWQADMEDGYYRNPVLYADYSDPDVIRVGADFYMTASSFNSSPGLPILHSRDLVNWTIVGHAVQGLPAEYGYDRVRHADGVWAPSIRYHDGKYWIYVGFPDEGIFMTCAEKPEGPWSPLHLVKAVKGWIDPCPFWDEDGRAYLVHAFAQSRCGIKHRLQMCRMAPDGRSLLDEGTLVFDGEMENPTTEGPKLYKRNGYYYIFAPAGGVATGWQLVIRSRDIFGPYEWKNVLHQGDSEVNGPHQGGYVELESGENWFVHFQEVGAYGRIIHLQPMSWVDDWPVMGVDTNGDGIGEPVMRYRKPDVGAQYPVAVPQMDDDFDGDALGLQWQWQANRKPEWYSLQARPGWLRLYAAQLPAGGTLFEAPNIVCQKFAAPAFTATAKMAVEPGQTGFRAGLTVFGHSFRTLSLSCGPQGAALMLTEGEGRKGQVSAERVLSETPIAQFAGEVLLQAVVTGGARCAFRYSVDGGASFHDAGEPFEASEGGWVGAKIGLFCVSLDAPAGAAGYADFDWIQFVG